MATRRRSGPVPDRKADKGGTQKRKKDVVKAIPPPTSFAAPVAGISPFGALDNYDPTKALEICRELMGGRRLKEVLELPDMPTQAIVTDWLLRVDEFREMYYYARRAGIEMIVDEIIEIADDDTEDYTPVYDKEGGVKGDRFNGQHVQRSKLRIETRKWLAEKLLPAIYGDKVQHSHGPTEGLAEMLSRIASSQSVPAPAIDGRAADVEDGEFEERPRSGLPAPKGEDN